MVTAVGAVATSRVSPTTAGTFGAVDVYNLWDALTPRARRSPSLAWVSNNSIQTLIRKADIYGGSSFWADLREGVPPTLMGAPIYESSAMTGTVTTGSDVLLAGRFEDYAIIDRLGVTLLHQPMVLGTNSRPMGRWFAMKRTSANVLNADSFRLLRL